MLVSKQYLWRNAHMAYYNYNFLIFTEIFTNSKFFKHLIINTCSESRIESPETFTECKHTYKHFSFMMKYLFLTCFNLNTYLKKKAVNLNTKIHNAI